MKKKIPTDFLNFLLHPFPPDQAAGVRMATLLQSFSNIGASVITAFVFSWELTLLCLAVVPFLTITAIAEMRTLAEHAAKEKKELEAAGKVRLFHPVQRLNSNRFVLGGSGMAQNQIAIQNVHTYNVDR